MGQIRGKSFIHLHINIMAVYFSIKKDAKSGLTPVFIRARERKLNVDIRVFTPFKVDARKWNGAHSSSNALSRFRNTEYGKFVYSVLDPINSIIETEFAKGRPLTTAQVKNIIADIVYSEHRGREENRLSIYKENSKTTLNRYISGYITDTESGQRQTEKGTVYAKSTIKSIKQALNQFESFQKETGRTYDFNDIDLTFYQSYTAWLRQKNYAINSIGKCIKQLKVIMHASEMEGFHNNSLWRDRRFKGTRVEADNIYLTKADLMAIQNADLSGLSPGHIVARDIFMVGVWTAQRVSDYNNIKKEDIHTMVVRTISDEPDPINPGSIIEKVTSREITVINIRQKKTGSKVVIPCSSDLKNILKKYDYNMPHLGDNVINRYIKDIAKAAGLTEKIDIVKTNGGVWKRVALEKYKLIHTHTARRTGATLMYLAGMDIYDIIKITGHSSPNMLRKYIKADSLEVVKKITEKYKYFD